MVTQKICYLKQNAVDELRKRVRDNLAWYRGGGDGLGDGRPKELDEYGEMTKTMDAACFDVLNGFVRNDSKDDKAKLGDVNQEDIKHIIAIFKALDVLLPQQAADERVWVYATHVSAKSYVANRWDKMPGDNDKAVKYILSHYFVTGGRGLIRDNAIARLWWMGHIASRCKGYTLEKTLKILLRESDVRANLLERSSVSMSAEIFSGVIRVLDKSLREKGDKPEMYKRSNFRDLMKMINQRGGRIVLNSLDQKNLDALFDDMVQQVNKQNAKSTGGKSDS